MKYTVESSLRYFPAWSGGKSTLDLLIERGDVDTVESMIEDAFYGQEVSDDDINDFLWFDSDTIAEWLGYEDWEAYVEGWSVEDLENAEEWFVDLEDVEEYERITGKKRSGWPKGEDGDGDFMEACQTWWDAQSNKDKVEIYYKETE